MGAYYFYLLLLLLLFVCITKRNTSRLQLRTLHIVLLYSLWKYRNWEYSSVYIHFRFRCFFCFCFFVFFLFTIPTRVPYLDLTLPYLTRSTTYSTLLYSSTPLDSSAPPFFARGGYIYCNQTIYIHIYST